MMAQSRGSALAGPRFCLLFRDRGYGTRAAKDGRIGRNDAADNKGNDNDENLDYLLEVRWNGRVSFPRWSHRMLLPVRRHRQGRGADDGVGS